MLEFYIQNRKRWKDRSLNKRRRALLNGMYAEGEPLWAGPYIAAIRNEGWARSRVYPYQRYLSRQVGKWFADVYSDLSHRPIYRQNRYLLKEAFMREMQWEDEYRRDWNEFIEEVPKNTQKYLPLQLRAYDTGFSGKYLAKYLIWYPSHKSTHIVIDKGHPPITGYLWDGRGWYGYYMEEVKVYRQELLLDSKGRPLFTKEEYSIHTPDGRPRIIPIGGPLLREIVTTRQECKWQPIKDYELRAYGHSRKLELLKEELGRREQ
jgi:hypothetical protein